MVPGISVQNTPFHRIAPHQWGDDTSVKGLKGDSQRLVLLRAKFISFLTRMECLKTNKQTRHTTPYCNGDFLF